MKIELYMDIFPGSDPHYFMATATANPGQKLSGTKRYKIVFEIPDPLEPDTVLEAKVEESN